MRSFEKKKTQKVSRETRCSFQNIYSIYASVLIVKFFSKVARKDAKLTGHFLGAMLKIEQNKEEQIVTFTVFDINKRLNMRQRHEFNMFVISLWCFRDAWTLQRNIGC